MRSVSTASLLLAAALITGCASVPDSPPAKIRLGSVSMFSGNSAREGLPDGWQTWTLSRFKRPTEYRLVTDNGITVVRARASSSASGLIHPLDLDPAQYRFLHWHWKVEELIKGADNSHKSTEDSPVRVVVSFAGDLDKLGFDDRVFFDQVKAITGQQQPYATLMYIWENRAERMARMAFFHIDATFSPALLATLPPITTTLVQGPATREAYFLAPFVTFVPAGAGVIEWGLGGTLAGLGIPLEQSLLPIFLYRFSYFVVPTVLALVLAPGAFTGDPAAAEKP